jgi:hypothetical protein
LRHWQSHGLAPFGRDLDLCNCHRTSPAGATKVGLKRT